MLAIGCGGNGEGGGGGGGSAGGGGRSYPTVSLGSSGFVSATFLSGKDRRAVGSQLAVFKFIQFQNGVADYIPNTANINFSPLTVQLDGYTINTRDIVVNFGASEASKSYVEYPLQVTQMQEIIDDEGNVNDLTSANGIAYVAPNPFDTRIRCFPGRRTAVQIRLDEDIIRFDQAFGVVFDEDRFTDLNYDLRYKAIRGFLADYVSFDLTNMADADRPTVTATADPADRIFFSGDGIAISTGVGSQSAFELLDPIAIKSGTVHLGSIIGGVATQNTYFLDEEDAGMNLVTALTGTWKDETKVISNPSSTTTAISFPTSDDGNNQQFVVYQKNAAGQIIAMFQGEIIIGVGNDITKGRFTIFPVSTVDDAIPTDQVDGTLSNLVYVNGVVVRGDWDVTSALPASYTMPTSGGFSVFRR